MGNEECGKLKAEFFFPHSPFTIPHSPQMRAGVLMPNVVVFVIAVRGSTCCKVFIVGAGAPGGVSDP